MYLFVLLSFAPPPPRNTQHYQTATVVVVRCRARFDTNTDTIQHHRVSETGEERERPIQQRRYRNIESKDIKTQERRKRPRACFECGERGKTRAQSTKTEVVSYCPCCRRYVAIRMDGTPPLHKPLHKVVGFFTPHRYLVKA